MRIISGIHKGRKIIAPKNLPTRPTTDQAKEGLFNILNHRIDFTAIKVLDLFSGIGSISLELGSRGATDITAIDNSPKSSRFLKQISADLGLPIKVQQTDALVYLKETTSRFDLIFADPPYDYTVEQFTQIITLVFESDLLNPDGVLIIEHSKYTRLEEHPNLTETRKYGNTVFSFFYR